MDNFYTPSRFRISYKDNSIIGIKIGKIESPWNGNIEFIPGNRYEFNRIIMKHLIAVLAYM